LKGFYKAPETLGTTQIFIPPMSADNAPQAFQVKNVAPKRWIVIYRGNFSAPKNGKFRFVGYCDDIIVVRLNGKNVLDGSVETLVKNIHREFVGLPWQGDDEDRFGLKAGEWFELKEGMTYAIDIMIGEVPGVSFCAFLLIQEDGVEYAKAFDQRVAPTFPVFQLVETKLPGSRRSTPRENFVTQ
jgi:hypothetical protein